MTHIINGMAGNIESHSELAQNTAPLDITCVLDTTHYGFSKLTVVNETVLTWSFVKGSDGSSGDDFTLIKRGSAEHSSTSSASSASSATAASSSAAVTAPSSAATTASSAAGGVTTVTEVVSSYTTYCPGPTTFTEGSQTYTVTKVRCAYTGCLGEVLTV